MQIKAAAKSDRCEMISAGIMIFTVVQKTILFFWSRINQKGPKATQLLDLVKL